MFIIRKINYREQRSNATLVWKGSCNKGHLGECSLTLEQNLCPYSPTVLVQTLFVTVTGRKGTWGFDIKIVAGRVWAQVLYLSILPPIAPPQAEVNAKQYVLWGTRMPNRKQYGCCMFVKMLFPFLPSSPPHIPISCGPRISNRAAMPWAPKLLLTTLNFILEARFQQILATGTERPLQKYTGLRF